MITQFKTLVFKNDADNVLDDYAIIVDFHTGVMGVSIGGCNIPELMTMDATIQKLKLLYPDIDFSSVKLIIVNVSEIDTSNTQLSKQT